MLRLRQRQIARHDKCIFPIAFAGIIVFTFPNLYKTHRTIEIDCPLIRAANLKKTDLSLLFMSSLKQQLKQFFTIAITLSFWAYTQR